MTNGDSTPLYLLYDRINEGTGTLGVVGVFSSQEAAEKIRDERATLKKRSHVYPVFIDTPFFHTP